MQSVASVLSLLKGMPLTVLVVLFAAPVLPIGEMEVASMLGVSEKTVRKHLRFLQVHGFVVRTGRYGGWNLTDGAFQLPLPMRRLSDGESGNGKGYRSQPSSTTSSLYVEGSGIVEEEVGNGDGNGKSYRSIDDGATTSPALRRKRRSRFGAARRMAQSRGLVQVFQEAGIGMNMWEELAGYEWVTADYVAAHCAKVAADGDPVSYAIHRMRCGDAAPVVVLKTCPKCGESSGWSVKEQRCYYCDGTIKR